MEVLTFELFIILGLGFDFFFMIRGKTRIISGFSKFICLGTWVVFEGCLFRQYRSGEKLDQAVLGSIFVLMSLFAYWNVVAFIKRSTTFSILINHSRGEKDREDDSSYIDLTGRIEEMKRNRWLSEKDPGLYQPTKRGRFIRGAYLLALKILGTRRVG